MAIWRVLAISLLFCLLACSKDDKSDSDDPLSTFEIEQGFKIELIASEPLIGDPVDMEIDELGKLSNTIVAEETDWSILKNKK